MFTLTDELYMISIDEENGSVIQPISSKLAYGLAGAILADLVLSGKINIVGNHRVELVNAEPTGDKDLDDAIELIKESDQPRKVTYWVRQFGESPKRQRQRLVKRIVDRGVISEEDNRLTWIVPYQGHPEQNASAKFIVKSRLREKILTGIDIEINELALLCIIKACDMLNTVFTRDERKMARQQIYELVVRKGLTNPLMQSIQEIEMAIESQVEDD